ncbi:MAG: carboxypeptidase regulatory-like domain-containing protein, partial [Bacteroidaceae bacterium]|nr:carboxypeptidase regulatory-like domain-containing protein [Bacteroidaceae bacterium]
MCKRLYFLIATFVLMVSAAVAQVTTSGMSGKITANNEVVIGAAVEAIHTPSGTRYVGVTNSKGMYYIQGMRAGGT